MNILNKFTGRKNKLLLIAIVLLGVLLAAGALTLSNNTVSEQKSPSESKTKELASKQPPETPAVPSGDENLKTACDLLNQDIARQTIGDGAQANGRLVQTGGLEAETTVCQYSSSTQSAVVVLYRYSEATDASEQKAASQRQVEVSYDDGNDITQRRYQAVSAAKGRLVVSASVVTGDNFNAQASEELLKKVMESL